MGTLGSPEADRLERLTPRDLPHGHLARRGRWAVVFLAEWCPYCREFAPAFAGLDVDGGRLAVADLTDYANPLWEEFGIEVVPTVIVFQDGAVFARYDGRPMEGLGPETLRAVRTALTDAAAR